MPVSSQWHGCFLHNLLKMLIVWGKRSAKADHRVLVLGLGTLQGQRYSGKTLERHWNDSGHSGVYGCLLMSTGASSTKNFTLSLALAGFYWSLLPVVRRCTLTVNHHLLLLRLFTPMEIPANASRRRTAGPPPILSTQTICRSLSVITTTPIDIPHPKPKPV